MQRKSSFVLIFTITILTLLTLLTHQLLRLVSVGTQFDHAMVDRERAEMIALGGINIAITQLTLEKNKDKKKAKKEFTNFLQRILPNLNRWQEFNLQEEVDGIDGELKICISCENGKININEVFDFKKQDFKPTYKKFISNIKFEGQKKKPGEFIKQLTKFLKKRKKKIDDISELQVGATPSISQLFYTPPKQHEKPKLAKPNKALAIQDIFTIWTEDEKLEALMLSDALSNMLGLKRPAAHDAELRKEAFKKVIKKFDPGVDQNTDKYWKIVKPMYRPKSTSKIANLKIFSSRFEPSCYSVLSSGKVGNVEQQLLAIIEKTTADEQDSSKPDNKEEKNNVPKKDVPKKEMPEQKQAFKVVRLYWI